MGLFVRIDRLLSENDLICAKFFIGFHKKKNFYNNPIILFPNSHLKTTPTPTARISNLSNRHQNYYTILRNPPEAITLSIGGREVTLHKSLALLGKNLSIDFCVSFFYTAKYLIFHFVSNTHREFPPNQQRIFLGILIYVVAAATNQRKIRKKKFVYFAKTLTNLFKVFFLFLANKKSRKIWILTIFYSIFFWLLCSLMELPLCREKSTGKFVLIKKVSFLAWFRLIGFQVECLFCFFCCCLAEKLMTLNWNPF